MSDQPVIIAELTPEPEVVAEVSPLPTIVAEVGALYAPPSPRYGAAPAALTAAEFATGVWFFTIPAINGTSYIVPDFAVAVDFSLTALIPAFGVAGAFEVTILPQTGAGLLTTLVVSDGVTAQAVLVGNELPTDLSAGVVFRFACDGVTDWTKESGKYTPSSNDFELVTAVCNLRDQPYVSQGDDGGGSTSYLNAHRVGDPADQYIAANPAANMSSSGTPYGGGAFALMDQANGLNGGFHGGILGPSLTFTIETPLGNIVVDANDFIVPKPVEGDVIGIRALTMDGQWQDSNLQQGQRWSVGRQTWQASSVGMDTDFVDITGGGGTGDVVGPASATANAFAVYNGTTGKLLKDGVVPGDAAAKNTGTGSGDVAAGNHTHTGPVVGGQDEGSSITNTTTPTSLLDSTISVTATAGQMVQVQGSVAYVNNSGTTRAPTMALKLGSTTVLTLTHQTIQASASTRAMPFNFTIRVEANSDINASGQTVSFNASGVGVMSSGRGTATEAIQSGVALDLIWTHPTTDATQTATLDYVVVTRMGGAGSIS